MADDVVTDGAVDGEAVEAVEAPAVNDGEPRPTAETPDEAPTARTQQAKAAKARRAGELPKTRPPEEAPWLKGFPRDKNNRLKTSYASVVAVLRGDTEFGRFSFNERTLQPEFNGRPLEEGTMLRLFEEIELRWGLTPGFETFVRAVMCVAREHSVEPVRDELERLVWDGVPRLDTVARRFLRNSGELEAVLIRKTIIAAIARALDPGCQVDTTCVLTGGQGALKSSFWRVLAGPENFGDSAIDIANKDGLLQMRASWFHELPEIDGITTRRHADQVKAFMTVRVDMFRPPYGRAVARYPRATILVGTTNRDDYLTDPTGSRRFWTVEVNADLEGSARQTTKIDVEALSAERDQLLAEAVEAYRAWRASGAQRLACLWWLTRDEDAQLAAQSLEHQESDVWEGPIEKWLAVQAGPRDAMEILVGALGFEKAKATRADQTRVGRIMHGLGYSIERQWNGGSRRRLYIRRESWYGARAQQSTAVDTTADAEPASADDDSPTDANDADPSPEDGGESAQSNQSNSPTGEVGLVLPHSRPGQSNQSNQSDLPAYVGTRAPAHARAQPPIHVGLVGLVGLDSKLGRETSPTSGEAGWTGWTAPERLDRAAVEPALGPISAPDRGLNDLHSTEPKEDDR
jgi:predicted P-loop ATPase